MAVSSNSHELVVAELQHAERCSKGHRESVVQDNGLTLNQAAGNLNVGVLCMCQYDTEVEVRTFHHVPKSRLTRNCKAPGHMMYVHKFMDT